MAAQGELARVVVVAGVAEQGVGGVVLDHAGSAVEEEDHAAHLTRAHVGPHVEVGRGQRGEVQHVAVPKGADVLIRVGVDEGEAGDDRFGPGSFWRGFDDPKIIVSSSIYISLTLFPAYSGPGIPSQQMPTVRSWND